MAEIVLDGVTKRYPSGALAVDHVSLHVADGELLVLVGPSGCGKSTLLHMVAGLEDITQGTLRIGGRVVNDVAPKDRDIAMVFQSYALYPHMTVRRNIGFPLELAHVDRAMLEQKVREVAELLELTPYLDAKPATLSGGQRQRVAMGRAIVRKPQAFLMDEPLSNLDARLRVQMRRELARIQDSLGVTTLYVTHDQTEAMLLGDRVAVMQRGVLQQVGTPQHLYEHPANLFVAGFIGSPSMNFLPGTLKGDRLRCPLGEIRMPHALHPTANTHGPSDVIVGIRPEHFEDATASADPDSVRFRAQVDAIESMGSDLFVYFHVSCDEEQRTQLKQRLADIAALDLAIRPSGIQVMARLSAGARVAQGVDIDLCCVPRHLHVFDGTSGNRLTSDTDRNEA